MLLEHVTAGALVAHAIGDYVIQSDWMANEKTKRWLPAIAHALSYTCVFLLLTTRWQALLIIGATHLVIDHWRLARYVCWAKNFLAPPGTVLTWELNQEHGEVPATWSAWWHPWTECVGTGYHKDRPPWMAVWLMIITDNVMHVLCNTAALYYWR